MSKIYDIGCFYPLYIEIYLYELNRLPHVTEENENAPALQWLRLINAETEEDLDMLENTNIPEIKDAVNVVRFFSVDKQMQHDAFEREMAIRDHEASIAAERQHGYSEGFEDGKEEEKRKYEEERRKYKEERQKYEEEKRKTVHNMLEKNLDDDLIISCTGVTAELLEEIKTGIEG